MNPTIRLFKAIWAGILYIVLLKWVPPLLRWIRDTILGIHYSVLIYRNSCAGNTKGSKPKGASVGSHVAGILNWINVEIVQPIWRIVKRIWAAFTFVVLLKWLPPLLRWIHARFIRPTIDAAVWFKSVFIACDAERCLI